MKANKVVLLIEYLAFEYENAFCMKLIVDSSHAISSQLGIKDGGNEGHEAEADVVTVQCCLSFFDAFPLCGDLSDEGTTGTGSNNKVLLWILDID